MASDSFSRESYELFLVATGARGMVVIETTGGGGGALCIILDGVVTFGILFSFCTK